MLLSPELLAKIRFFLDPSQSSKAMLLAAIEDMSLDEEPGIVPANVLDEKSLREFVSLWPDYYEYSVIEDFVKSFPSGKDLIRGEHGRIVASDFMALNPAVDIDALEHFIGDYAFASALFKAAFGLNPSGNIIFDRIRYEEHSFGSNKNSFFDEILDYERYISATWMTRITRKKDWSKSSPKSEWVAAFSKACERADSEIMQEVGILMGDPRAIRAMGEEMLVGTRKVAHALASYILAYPGKFEEVQRSYAGTLEDYEILDLFKSIFRLGFEGRQESGSPPMPIEERLACYCKEVAFVNNLARALNVPAPGHLLEGII